MKKLILMALVVVMVMSMAVFASAETTAYQPDNNGKYTVTYNVGEANKNEMYGFVVIKGTDVIDLDNIDDYVYIDQATADENGNITFANFGLKGALPSDDAFVESTAYIGGKGFDGAENIGVLVADSGCVVTGAVTDTNNPRTATVTFKDAQDVTVATAQATNGAFSVEVGEGTYTVVFTKGGSLSHTYTGVVVDGDEVLKTVNMGPLAGNINSIGGINLADLSILAVDYEQSELANEYADINNIGGVNLTDLAILAQNYENVNVSEAYAN